MSSNSSSSNLTMGLPDIFMRPSKMVLLIMLMSKLVDSAIILHMKSSSGFKSLNTLLTLTKRASRASTT